LARYFSTTIHYHDTILTVYEITLGIYSNFLIAKVFYKN